MRWWWASRMMGRCTRWESLSVVAREWRKALSAELEFALILKIIQVLNSISWICCASAYVWMFSSHLSWFMMLCRKQQFCHETLTILVIILEEKIIIFTILDIYANFLGCIFLQLLSTTPTFPGAPEPWTVIRPSIVPKSPGFFLGASLKAKERISWQMLIAGLWKVGSERTRGHVTRSW